MPEEEKRGSKGLENSTIVFMVVVAVFFDLVQMILTFLFLGWLVGIFAGLTFWLWFKLHGISFMKPKRLAVFGGASLIEMFPIIPFSTLPAWTAAVVFLSLDSKVKKLAPRLDIIKK